MTIRLLSNAIQIGSIYLTEYEDGIEFLGNVGLYEFVEGTTAPFAIGTVSGYSSGGGYNTIDKFPFALDTNAVDVGDLILFSSDTAGQSSSTDGYVSGGSSNPSPTPSLYQNVIQKFPFAANANATDVGDLTVVRAYVAGQSSSTDGYTSGGYFFPPGTFYNVIDKFPFAANANATDVGDLTVLRWGAAGQSSYTEGYNSGGVTTGPTWVNTIDKFPFAANANATDVGDLSQRRSLTVGQSSITNGYTSSGYFFPPGISYNTIDKFPFASNANATDVGDLLQTVHGTAGQSSSVNGYTTGGQIPLGATNVIQKFPFASDANATDVGNLTVARSGPSGQQN